MASEVSKPSAHGQGNNVFRDMARNIPQEALLAMQDTGEVICDAMRGRLAAAGHIDTGALYDSIHQETSRDGDIITTYIYANAKSESGDQYAEFIELGTGAAHGREGGRVGTWRYKDRFGNWHTTDGMDADPFIEPSVEENLPRISEFLTERMYEIAKYGLRRSGDD